MEFISINLDHIGIAVKNIESTAKMYNSMFGLIPFHYEEIEDQGVKACFIQIGEQKLELLEAINESSPIHKFIEKRGEGLHHMAYRVENIKDALKDISDRGFRLIDHVPRRGALNKLIAFIHPKDTHGVLIELCQPMSTEEEED